MDMQQLSDFLLWSLVINYAILLWWFTVFTAAHGWMFRLHTRWFRLTAEHYNSIHYTGMAIYKIGVLLFNLTPYIALQIIMSHAG